MKLWTASSSADPREMKTDTPAQGQLTGFLETRWGRVGEPANEQTFIAL